MGVPGVGGGPGLLIEGEVGQYAGHAGDLVYVA